MPKKVKGYASGGLIEKPQTEDWTDNIVGRVRRVTRDIRDPIDQKPPENVDKRMERVTKPDLDQSKDRLVVGGAYAKGGKVTTKRAGDRNMTSKGKPRLSAQS